MNGIDMGMNGISKPVQTWTKSDINKTSDRVLLQTDDDFSLSAASRINEQLAFMSTWELFLGFIRLHKEEVDKNYRLPDTYHNNSFLDTITRSLFMANQLNALSTPLIANVFFLLEKYFEVEEQNNILKAQLEVIE